MKSFKFRYFNYFLIFTLAIWPINHLMACTGILLKTANQEPVYARTLEFGIDLQSQILFMPRNYVMTAATDRAGVSGLQWTTKYATIGANAFGLESYVDGVNEEGLAGGLFYFPGFAGYQKVKDADYANSLPMWQLLTWILTNFKNVAEVKEALPQVFVTDVILPQFQDSVPAHLIIHDLAGKSLVIEYVQGKLQLYDNKLGVFTNSPEFSWHLTNLRNYLNLSPMNVQSKELLGLDLKQLSQGSGLHGLPGDFTSPSRFVRATQFMANSPTPKTTLEAVYQVFHILNNFDIPKGSVVDSQGHFEFTTWTSAIDLKNQIFYFRPYANFQLQKFELNKMNFSSPVSKQLSPEVVDQII